MSGYTFRQLVLFFSEETVSILVLSRSKVDFYAITEGNFHILAGNHVTVRTDQEKTCGQLVLQKKKLQYSVAVVIYIGYMHKGENKPKGNYKL